MSPRHGTYGHRCGRSCVAVCPVCMHANGQMICMADLFIKKLSRYWRIFAIVCRSRDANFWRGPHREGFLVLDDQSAGIELQGHPPGLYKARNRPRWCASSWKYRHVNRYNIVLSWQHARLRDVAQPFSACLWSIFFGSG
jgi:hypothetical protein